VIGVEHTWAIVLAAGNGARLGGGSSSVIRMGGLDREAEGTAGRVRQVVSDLRGEGKTLFDGA
jgi:hypothetical protein